MTFDYYGETEIKGFLNCQNLTEEPFNETKDPGYRYTCQISLLSEPINLDNALDNPEIGGVDACCINDSPLEAVVPWCNVDLAEEVCQALSNKLNDFRKTLGNENSDLGQQLLHLNEAIAAVENQKLCSKSIASELNEPNSPNLPEAEWILENNLDDDSGYSWFREVEVNIDELEFDSVENQHLFCSSDEWFGVIRSGAVTGGSLHLESSYGNTNAKVQGGSFSFRRSSCGEATCPFKFETFVANIEAFHVGPLKFSHIQATLKDPAFGVQEDTQIGFRTNEMHFDVSFRLALNGLPLFGGQVLSVEVNNYGAALARLLPGPQFGIQRIEARSEPFDVIRLTTKLSACN